MHFVLAAIKHANGATARRNSRASHLSLVCGGLRSALRCAVKSAELTQ